MHSDGEMRTRYAYVYIEIKFLQPEPGFPFLLLPVHNYKLIENGMREGERIIGTLCANLNLVCCDNKLSLLIVVSTCKSTDLNPCYERQ